MDVMTLTTKQLQRHVVKELARSAKGRLTRRTILKALTDLSPTKLNRRQREVVKVRLNNAIGAMQHRVPKKITRGRGSSDVVMLVKQKKASRKPPLLQLIEKVKNRVTAIEFTCSECTWTNRVEDVENEIQCVHCHAYFV